MGGYRLFVLLAAATVAALALVPAGASAGQPTALKVRSCRTGTSDKERTATFYARMHAVPGAVRMQMRFTLLDRSADPSTVKSPALARWRSSLPGVRSFGYAQKLSGLKPGGVYSVLVHFRWLSASGKVVKSVRRRSADCRQDGALPNVAVRRITMDQGVAEGTARYGIEVTNDGAVSARSIRVDLYVDGAAANSAVIDVLRPGESATVRMAGPRCARGLRAVADRSDSIHETTEDDNALAEHCPPSPR
jgi:hypothetical protein